MNRRRGYSQDDPRRQPPRGGGGPGPPPSMFSKIRGGAGPGRNSRSASPYGRPSRSRSGGGRRGGGFGVPWGRGGGGGGERGRPQDYDQLDGRGGAEPRGRYGGDGGRERSRSRSGGRSGQAGRRSPADESVYTTTSREQGGDAGPGTDDGVRGSLARSSSRNSVHQGSSRSLHGGQGGSSGRNLHGGQNGGGGGGGGGGYRDPQDYMPRPSGGGGARRRFPGGGMPGLFGLSANRGGDEDANWDGLSSHGSRASRGGGGGGVVCKSGRHPRWVLPPGVAYAPRVDAWSALLAASAAAVASVGRVYATSDPARLSASDGFALATCAMTLAASLGMGLGLRYGPLRGEATRPRFQTTYSPFVRVALSGTTYELAVLCVLSFFWLVAMPTVCDGRSAASGSVAYAVKGAEVWNANLFYSSWATFLLVVYLTVEVWSLRDRRAVVRTGSRRPPSNALTKRWAYLVFVGFVVMGASLHLYTGPACQGSILRGTDYCRGAITGAMVGGLAQVLAGAGVAFLYRLSSDAGRAGMYNDAGITAGQRDRYCFAAAGVSLVLQGVNAGLVTGPLGGGPGNNAGTMYFASWLGFAAAFELCLRYFDLAGTTPSRSSRGVGGGASVGSNRSGQSYGSRSRGSGDVTVYEDVYDDEESMLKLGNGSAGNGGFPALTDGNRNGHNNSSNYNGSSNNATYGRNPTVTDVDDDGESFVFGSSRPQSGPSQGRGMEPHNARGDSTANPHRGGGMEPEEEKSDIGSRSRRSSGSEGGRGRSVGSIDVRPKAEPEPENFFDAASNPAGDMDNSAFLTASAGSRSQENDEGYGYGDSGYSAGFGASDPSPAYPPQRPSYSSYLEELDGLDDEPVGRVDVPTGPTPRQPGVFVPPPPESLDGINTNMPGLPIPRNSSNHSGLSPLHEHSGEDTSPTDSGSKAKQKAPFAQQQAPMSRGSRSSRSRPMGSRKSSARSNLTGGPSTASRDLSAVLTVDGSDSSGSDPPPTVSDGSSSKSSLSGFSRERGRARASPYGVNAPQDQSMPPAPPFQRNVNADMYDDISTYTNSAPMRTISKVGDSDTIVSDPTLDPSLFPPPSTSPPSQNSGPASRASNNSSSFNKKCSDETEYKNYQRTSSDENPSSKSASEAGEVDNIVAAALAYAERTHGDDSGGRSGSNNQRSRSRSTGRRSGSAGKRRPSNFTEGDASSSIHSFYTEDEGGGGRASNSQSTGNPRYTGPGAAAPVDDLVAQALSHAQSRFGSGLSASGKSRNGPASFHGSNPQAHSYESKKGAASFHAQPSNGDSGGASAFRSGAMANQKANFKSEYSAWNKSVMSMYSEETEEPESMGDQYDC